MWIRKKRAPADFVRLSECWYRWARWMGGGEASVSVNCDDCKILFATDDYSIHLRNEGNWWIVDTVNDRGQRHNDTIKMSTFELVEKYLTWDWTAAAHSPIGRPSPWAKLYSRGFSADVEAILIAEGIAELRSPIGSAVLMEPYAKIFSHLMLKSIAEIERISKTGLECRR